MTPIDQQVVHLCSGDDQSSLQALLATYTPPWHAIIDMLTAATASNNVGLVRYLLSLYPDIHLAETPVRKATYLGSIQLFDAFYQRDPSVVSMIFEKQGPPLSVALMSSRPLEFISYLLSHGADPNQEPEFHPYALAAAVFGYRGSTEVLDLLLASGARVQRMGALHMCAYKGYTDVARYLLQHGVTPETDTPEHYYHCDALALHCAIAKGDLGMVELLLQHGADKSRRDKEGKTAFDIAEEKGDVQILGLLKE
ncbi:hypothetical protein AJ79_06441 [Helicocarpus griseus UAMH5409]|uniref:Uncharacterized protein n=1 Tax=Helicocarpus griseus UAMH5409 TaxID=1447875 RepID=A0A2B7XCZ9_9EURO|nr:hypothetical protein AJ79_06441 [Helicocarpus griseus UAMH5409]